MNMTKFGQYYCVDRLFRCRLQFLDGARQQRRPGMDSYSQNLWITLWVKWRQQNEIAFFITF